MNLENVFLAVIEYYQSDSMRVIGLVTWLMAWRAAYLISKNPRFAFKAHVLYSISNVCLLAFNYYYGHIEMTLMALTFLYTSLKGCVTYWPKKKVNDSIRSEQLPEGGEV